MNDYIRPFKSIDEDLLFIAPFEKKALLITNTFCKEYGAFLAGGFPLAFVSQNKDYGDLDFFFTSDENLQKAVAWITQEFACSEHNEDSPYFGETIYAHTFHVADKKVQLIKIVSGSIEEVLNTFDFDNCKIAITWNDETHKYDFIAGSLFPELIQSKKFRFRRQINIDFTNKEHRENFAEANMQRLEKYMNRFPGGYYDDETRRQLLMQFAWDCQYVPLAINHKEEIFIPKHLYTMLTAPEATLEDLIMFFPLGGKFKQIFEKKAGRFKEDVVESPTSDMIMRMF